MGDDYTPCCLPECVPRGCRAPGAGSPRSSLCAPAWCPGPSRPLLSPFSSSRWARVLQVPVWAHRPRAEPSGVAGWMLGDGCGGAGCLGGS